MPGLLQEYTGLLINCNLSSLAAPCHLYHSQHTNHTNAFDNVPLQAASLDPVIPPQAKSAANQSGEPDLLLWLKSQLCNVGQVLINTMSTW